MSNKKYQKGGAVDLIKLAAIESSLDPEVISDTEDYGLLQINAIALESYNKYNKSKYTTKDLLNPEINVKVGDWFINKRIPALLKSEGLEDNLENRLAAYNQGARGLAKNGPSMNAVSRLNQYKSIKYDNHSNHIYIERAGKLEKLGIHPALGISPHMMGPNIVPDFKEGGNLENTTGYTPGTPSFDNRINIIPSNHITMKNTPFNVLGIPDKGSPRLMTPGSEHYFPGAKKVKEIPMRQYGGPIDFVNFLTNSLSGAVSGVTPLTGFGSNSQANSVLRDGIAVGGGFLQENNNIRDNKIDALKDKYTGSKVYDGYVNQNMPFGEFWLPPGSTGQGAEAWVDGLQTAQGQYNDIHKSYYENMKGAEAANAFGVLFSLNQRNQANAERRATDPLYHTNMKNYTTGPTIVQHGGKMPKYQEGGEVQVPVQTEKGETVLLPNGKLVDVNAKKPHKLMDGKEVTDILPGGSFVFSNDKNMKISRKEAEKIELGYQGVHYDENKIGTPPDMMKLSDFFKKGQSSLTFAGLSKNIRNKYKVSERENDSFAAKAAELNKANRMPLLEILRHLNEEKMPKKVKEEQGIDSFQFGGSILSSKFSQPTNNAIVGMDTVDLVENRDKALRNDGLFPTEYYSQNMFKGLRSNNSFLKGQFGLSIGMGLLGGLNQILGSRAANNSYRQRISEIEDLNSELRGRVNLGSGIQALGTLGQDTSYTRLNTDPMRAELLSGYRGAEQAIESNRDITNNQINAGSRTLLRGLTDAGFDPGVVASNYNVSRAQANDQISRNNVNTAASLADLRLRKSAGLQQLIGTDQAELKNAANYTRGANNQILRNLADIGTQNQNSLATLAQMNDNLRAQATQDRATRQAMVTNNTFQLLGGAASMASNIMQSNRLSGINNLRQRSAMPTTMGYVEPIGMPTYVQSNTTMPPLIPIHTSPYGYPIN